MEGLREFFLSLGGFWGYMFLFASSLAENLFPPLPGDTFVVLGAFLVGRGQMSLLPAYLATTAGSLSGFILLFFAGRSLGWRFFQNGKNRLFPQAQIEKVEKWLQRYGYRVIAANRFLSGARAVVSLVAGMAGLRAGRVCLLALASCLVWNAGLMALGIWMGKDWERILRSYQTVVFCLVLIIIIGVIIRKYMVKVKRS